ncbi:MAG: DUF72 domain-containing protein [Spirochaetota bacterium]
MGRISIGTSGYSYKDWIGPYYPPGTKPSEFLSYYARDFGITELNFTYYTLPDRRTFDRLIDKTPDTFRFVVKANRSLTHDRSENWKEHAHRFREALTSLHDTGRLAGVLLQFPYSFHYTTENRRYLGALCAEFSSVPLFLEYRHRDWQRSSVYEEMRTRNLAVVIPDMPPLHGLPSSTPVVTADRGYLRFHGRNARQWWEGDNRSRYDYLYGEEELREWVDPIRSLAGELSEVFIMFNNHANAQAVINAKALARMLSG